MTKKKEIDENTKIQLILAFVDIMDKCKKDTVTLIKQALLDLLGDSDRVSAHAVDALKKFCAQSEVRDSIQSVASRDDVRRTLSMEKALHVLKECNKL